MKKINRCAWAQTDPLYIEYHDNEWGVPLHDDKKLFELLVLEGFQAGLSWITILKKRKNFAKAFSQWNWDIVASYGSDDRERLINDPGIIRNRLKINAAINNANRFIEIRKEFGSFDNYIWRFTDFKTVYPAIAPKEWSDLPVRTAQSDAMSKDLKKRGFSFCGSVICYAYMQATGIVNDHLVDCFKFHLFDTIK